MAKLDDQKSFWLYCAVLSIAIFALSMLFGEILGAFFWSLIIALLLQPAMNYLVGLHVGRAGAAAILVLAFILLFAGLVFSVFPLISNSLISIAQDFPKYAQTAQELSKSVIIFLPERLAIPLQEQLATGGDTISQHISTMASWIVKFLGAFFLKAARVVNLVSLFILSPLLIFYFLRDWPLITQGIDRLVPNRALKVYIDILQDMGETLSAYFKGQLLVCTILGIYYALTLWFVVGLNYAWTIGLVAGFLALIPYVGFTVSLLVSIGVAFSQFTFGTELLSPVIKILSVFFVGQLIENFLLVPNLVGDRIQVHPVWIIFALMAAGYLFGFVGILLAVPLAALVRVLVNHLLRFYTQLQGQG